MNSENNIFNQLNSEQKQAVTFGEGPLLIVAGAGTGKTTVITQRIAYLIGQGKAKPEEILAVTFTDKAAGEMEERADKLLPIGYLDLWISTFHSFCERVLKTHGLDIGLPIDFKLLDQTAAWMLVRQNLDRFHLDYYKPLGNPTRFLHALLSHFSRCKDQVICPEDYLALSEELKSELTDLPETSQKERLKEIANAYYVYQKLLLENNGLDFGDLINYCLKLFCQRPLILEKYCQKFKYILVDEFQDTNWAQYELVKLLVAPRNNLMVTADDDQAIFRFRGASYNNVLQFRKDYPQVKEITLIKNYRSSQNILDRAYQFIQANNPNRLESVDKINKKLIAEKSDEGIIEHLHFNTFEEEAAGVANRIIALLKEDAQAILSDFAILVRANDTAQNFGRALERAEIPYYFAASRGLYAKAVVLDVISYFKLLDNYHESPALYRILNLPFFEIPVADIMRITEYCWRKSVSLYEALQSVLLISHIGQKTAAKINFILGLIQKHSQMARKKTVSELFVNFLEDSGYLRYLISPARNGSQASKRACSRSDAGRHQEKSAADSVRNQDLNLLAQFYDKIKAFENSNLDAGLKNFLGQLDMELESGEQGKLSSDIETGPDMVRLMTVHGAKGLEFKYVFLVNLVDKRFPTIERAEPIEVPKELVKEILPEGDVHLEEERRLCYVAMTRAKKGLFFTSSDDCGGQRKKKVSRFLTELGFNEDNKISGGLTSVKFASVKTATEPVFRAKSQSQERAGLLPPHFSFSQLTAFSHCPLQYKFAHILKVPVRGKAVFSFGKTMHETLYEFVRLLSSQQNFEQGDLFTKSSPVYGGQASASLRRPDLRKITFEDLVNIYEKKWLDEWYEDKLQKEEYYKLGKKTVKKFYDDFQQKRPKILYLDGLPALEQWFTLKLGNYTLKGRIDRIDRLGDDVDSPGLQASEGVELIDYKTGKSKEKLTKEEKEQLLIYQMAAQESLGLKPEKLTYYYLDEGKQLSFLGSDKEIAEEKEKIIGQMEDIKKSDFSATPGWQCKSCDFRNICEHAAYN